MNTGLQDVWNLVWKLGLFLHGHGNEGYSTAITLIKSVIEATDFLTKIMATRTSSLRLCAKLLCLDIASGPTQRLGAKAL
jgi:hypothetical protein